MGGIKIICKVLKNRMRKVGRVQEREEVEFSAGKTSDLILWTQPLAGGIISERPFFLSYVMLYLL